MIKDLDLKQVEWDLHENNVDIIPLEFTEEVKPEIYGLELIKAQEMTSGLITTISEREVLKKSYSDVIQLEITTETLPIFKELRLKIVKNRTQGIEKWHKVNKEFYLNGGRFVDAIKNKEIIVNQEMEAKLLEAEKYFENLEKEKANLLNESRVAKLVPYIDDVFGLDFSAMTDEDFDDYLLGKKTRFENAQKENLEAEQKAEAERLAEIERQKAIEIENAKLKAEAEAKELVLKQRNETLRPFIRYIRDYDKVLNLSDEEFEKEVSNLSNEAIETMKFEAEQERQRLQKELDYENEKKERQIEANKQAELQAQKDAEIKKEREAREKLEADLKAKKDAELKAEQEAKKEADKLAKAPVKKQLQQWVNNFEIPTPIVENDLSLEIAKKFEAFKKWSLTEIEKL